MCHAPCRILKVPAAQEWFSSTVLSKIIIDGNSLKVRFFKSYIQ